MMKRNGIREDYAAAIEAVASSGGQMMPPVMGIAAFLMADILQVPYATIIQYALLPALFFYVTVALIVYLLTFKHGWQASIDDKIGWRDVLDGVHFIVPLLVLLYTLLVLRFSPLAAGKYTVLSLAVVSILKKVGESPNPGGVVDAVKSTTDALVQGAIEAAPIMGVIAAIGLAIAMIQRTGSTFRISQYMVLVAGGSLVLLLILTMVTSILFGMGMPTIAAYLLLVVIVTPALLKQGISQPVTHLYVLYFGMLSAITPPVAISVVIGTEIAQSDFLQTAKQALRVGSPGFIVPYAFVMNTSLIYWSFPMTIFKALVTLVAMVAIAVAASGYTGRRSIGLAPRLGLVGLAFVGLFTPLVVQVGATILIIALLVGDWTGIVRRESVPE
jgi:TRAP transporter 4TM/12TM fusion protein